MIVSPAKIEIGHSSDTLNSSKRKLSLMVVNRMGKQIPARINLGEYKVKSKANDQKILKGDFYEFSKFKRRSSRSTEE